MITKHRPGLVLILLLLLLTGCSSRVRYPNYYSLTSAAPTLEPKSVDLHLSATLAVRNFETPEYLRQGRIVYRQSPEEIGFYDYHRWAADPGVAVTTSVIESLRSSNLFSVVEPYDGRSRPQYILSGRVDRLDEIDYKGGVKVEARISAQLLDTRTGALVWANTATETSDVPSRSVSAVVAAMNHAAQSGVDQLVASLGQQLSGLKMAQGSMAQDSGTTTALTK